MRARAAALAALIDADETALASAEAGGTPPVFLSEHRYQLALRRAEHAWLITFTEALRAGSLATAARLAGTFQGRGTGVVLEPLTEPRQALDPVWNNVAAELTGAVRDQDRRRTILIGPRTMSNARFLGELSLPEPERNLIVAIHHYWPIRFTMQGELFLGENHVFGNPGTGSAPPGRRNQPRKPGCAPDSPSSRTRPTLS